MNQERRFQSNHIREDRFNEIKQIAADARKSVNEKIERWANKLVVGASPRSHISGRLEGEVWEDGDGRKWTKRGGIVQNVTKLDLAKTPWFCPVCEKVMNSRLDDKFYRLRGHCFDCQIKDEHKMRLEGTYEAYERRLLRLNEMSWIRDAIIERETYIREFKEPTLYFEDGRYEVLAKKEEFEPMFEQIRNDIQFLLDRLSVLEKEQEEEDAASQVK